MLRWLLGLMMALASLVPVWAEPWRRHVIDASSRGADGARLADFNGDGLPDIVTPWEEGNRIDICLNPGPARYRHPWPTVTVGQVKSPEDAMACDLDGDGALDVISCCEGRERTMYVHWGPADGGRLLDPSAWKTEPIPATQHQQLWMFALPLDVNGSGRLDLVTGSKGTGAAVGWLESPADPRGLADWHYHRLTDAGWIMSVVARDMNGNGRADVLFTDRYGPHAGVRWLEHPGDNARSPWRVHTIGAVGQECMFLDMADINGDGRDDIVVAVKPRKLVLLFAPPQAEQPWTEQTIEFPAEGFGTSKAVRAADIMGDGRIELLVTCEQAQGQASGVLMLTYDQSPLDTQWKATDIGGPQGVKYDLIELLDLDGDGDLDLITCEERDNLGVVWYENPSK